MHGAPCRGILGELILGGSAAKPCALMTSPIAGCFKRWEGGRDLPAPSPTRKKRRPEASSVGNGTNRIQSSYCRSCRTDLGFRLACASIAVLDCIRIWFFV